MRDKAMFEQSHDEGFLFLSHLIAVVGIVDQFQKELSCIAANFT